MADRTYKLTMELSNGNSIEVGTFTVPAGDPGEESLFYCGETGSNSIVGNSTIVLKSGLFNRTPKVGDKGSGIGFPLGVSAGKIYLFTFTVNSVEAAIIATCNTVDTMDIGGGSNMTGYLKVLNFSGIAIPAVGGSTNYPFAVGSLEVKNGDKVLICRPGDNVFTNAIALVTVTNATNGTATTNWLMEETSGGGGSDLTGYCKVIKVGGVDIAEEGSSFTFPNLGGPTLESGENVILVRPYSDYGGGRTYTSCFAYVNVTNVSGYIVTGTTVVKVENG